MTMLQVWKVQSGCQWHIKYLGSWRSVKVLQVKMASMLQIEKCKLSIREAVKECDKSSGDRQILARHFDEDGEIDQKWIFCAKCSDAESYEV